MVAKQRIPTKSAGSPVRGLTLAELVIVLAILAVVGTLVLPAIGRHVAATREDVTRQSLVRLRDVIGGMYWDDMASLPEPGVAGLDAGRQAHPQVRYLFVNPLNVTESTLPDYDPAYRRGWRGPYVTHQGGTFPMPDANFSDYYGEEADPAVLDGWGNPIVIQNPGWTVGGARDVRLVSAGPNGVLNIPLAQATVALTETDQGDDVWLAFEVR